MSAGIPIVASDITGYSLVARAGSDALLTEPGNPDALAGALSAVLAGGHGVHDRVERGRQRANEFSMETLADVYTEMYERVLATG